MMMMTILPQAEHSTNSRLRAVCVTIALATYSCCVLTATVSAASQQQQQLQAADEPSALRSLLMLEHTNKKLQEEKQQQQQQAYRREEKHKLEVRRRLHKLIDELVDAKLDEPQQQQHEQQQQQTYPTKPQNKRPSAVSAKTKRGNKWSSTSDEQQLGDDKIVIIVKQPISGGADGSGAAVQDLQSVVNNLELALVAADSSQAGTGQQQPAPARRPKMDAGEHSRRVVDDQFGIRRESLFSTNNHLGLKGVPKFGSEEEY